YLRDTALMAQTFDPEQGQLKGVPHLVAEAVAQTLYRGSCDASENGVLIYQAGGSRGERRLSWFDRTGKEMGIIGEAGAYYGVRLSPDVFTAGDPSDISVDELVRGVRIRLTSDPGTDKGTPVWSPDGSRILF